MSDLIHGIWYLLQLEALFTYLYVYRNVEKRNIGTRYQSGSARSNHRRSQFDFGIIQ